MKPLFLFALFYTSSLFAQITITSTDVSNYFAVGTSSTIHSTDAASFDIGTVGVNNNWDFSGLQSTETFNLICVDVTTTPYSNQFDNANIATYSQKYNSGYLTKVWSYLSLGETLGNMGYVAVSNSGSTIVKNDPAAIDLQLPLTLNTSWSQTYTESIVYHDSIWFLSNFSINVLVDAYGTMSMPNGVSFEALRIRESISALGVRYSFLAKNGTNVTVYTSDPNLPTSGVINADWYEWNLPFTTDVEQIIGLPRDFSLGQNYPNPFNPSTTIKYSIPISEFVTLKIFDVLGNEVATLVNEEKPAGSYEVNFDATQLSSGIYFYKIQSSSFIETKKMILIK